MNSSNKRRRSPRPLVHPSMMLIGAAFILLWSALIAGRWVLQSRLRAETRIEAPGIDTLRSVELGGCKQWLLMRGHDREKPLLLFLHGGPGAPLFAQARHIGRRSGLEKEFVVVYWEQRGTGKSFGLPPEHTMNVEQFVADIGALTDSLRQWFNRPQIVLLGRSWGCLIGFLAVQQAPERYAAFIGVSPLVAPLTNDSLSFRRAWDAAVHIADERAFEALAEIGEPPYDPHRLIEQRRWTARIERQIASGYAIPSSRLYRKQLLAAPEYRLLDILNMGRDPFFSLKHLWNDRLYAIDLRRDLPEIAVPVVFLVGRQDLFTPIELAEAYFQSLYAPAGKRWIVFEQAGHDPLTEQPEQFYAVLRNSILPMIPKSGH